MGMVKQVVEAHRDHVEIKGAVSQGMHVLLHSPHRDPITRAAEPVALAIPPGREPRATTPFDVSESTQEA